MKLHNSPLSKEQGVSLIEVLVTLVILLLGLLGLAATMVQGQRSETESYQRVQALVLLQDMVSRINTNRQVASCYAITTDTEAGSPFLGTGSSITSPTCTSGSTAQNSLAAQDLLGWSSLLQGASELAGTDNVGAMVGARGCVSLDALTGVYQVSVAWQGIGKTSAPPDTWNCGKGQYGSDEAFRRVVSVTLRIADL